MRAFTGKCRGLLRGSSLREGYFAPSAGRRGISKLSHVRGPSEPPLLESTIGEHFARIVNLHGDRTAVISKHQNERVTYAALNAKSNAFARGLESVGVRTGDRVGVMLGNSMEYSIATYALFKLGAILVPINPSFNASQVVSALAHLEACHLIISAESNLPRKNPRSNVPLLEHLVKDLSNPAIESEVVPSLKAIILVDNSSGRVDSSGFRGLTAYKSLTSDAIADGSSLLPRNLSPSDIVNIQFTSGTTATPKAACLTHHSILNNGSQIGDRMRLTAKDIVCCPPPLFHCFGSVLGFMATATHGSAIVFPSESFNARASLRAVQEEKCTALYGVPTMFLEQLNLLAEGEIANEGFEYLRTGIAAGSSIPATMMKRLHKVLNLTELTICYGMTETSPVSAMTTTDDPIDKRMHTVGRLLPHVEAKVVSLDGHRQTAPVDVRGELAVSGYLLMKEYWNDPERTAEVMIADDNGKVWIHTGDEASISADGYVSITGRVKDLIIRGGENIHPLEIENCLLTYPGVIDNSVVGVPDERYGEVVAAFIIHRDPEGDAATEEKIRDWVAQKLSNHLVPKHIFFCQPTDAFPKTASGKVQKFKLRDAAVRILKGEESPSGILAKVLQ
ncbi:AMP-binding enzyme [Aspergillus heteromorphus CBS 117.55]|uniref:AMP-binding enzyme n=1 Tax=Aspergillus heteromorphus CBS 117.55 TaxID=1448321 RepID=A0A317WY60_9EURO|nr:AMP-binding enzyme [Aspergillus heteromorphus CBS 117.55]PWY90915.1 AMP-binding enzyme [Aspergillus heteromorphus CBS 117.55]